MAEALPADPVDFFRSEFYKAAETAAERIEVLQNVNLIATCLTPQDVRTRLVPLLHEMASPNSASSATGPAATSATTGTTTGTAAGSTSNATGNATGNGIGNGTGNASNGGGSGSGGFEPDDEVLHAIALRILDVSDFVGGPQEFPCLLPTLECLALQDETVVREAVVNVLQRLLTDKCSEQFRPVFITSHLMPLYLRLATSDVFTGRVCASQLCGIMYSHLSADQQAEARKIYTDLCHDETPLVRRAAASTLEQLVRAADASDAVQNLLDMILDFWKDPTRDQLRVSAMQALTELSTKADETAFKRHILPILRQASCDASWKVRLAVVKALPQVFKSVSRKVVSETLAPWLENLLLDQEPEIQASAVSALADCVSFLSARSIESRLLPLFDHLVEISESPSRAGLASVLGPVAKKLGKEKTKESLLPIIEKLMDDKSREVRLNCVRQFSDFCEVLETAWATEYLWGSVHLAFVDSQWRIRLALVQQIPRLAKLFGATSFFRSKWERIYFEALLDSVCAVRFAAVDSVVELGLQFGQEWAMQYLLMQLLELYDLSFKDDPEPATQEAKKTDAISNTASVRSIRSYTARNTLLHALEQIAFVVPLEALQTHILPRFLITLNDPLPNIRFTTLQVLTTLIQANRIPPNLVKETIEAKIKACKESDSDVDVVYHARLAEEACMMMLKSAG